MKSTYGLRMLITVYRLPQQIKKNTYNNFIDFFMPCILKIKNVKILLRNEEKLVKII